MVRPRAGGARFYGWRGGVRCPHDEAKRTRESGGDEPLFLNRWGRLCIYLLRVRNTPANTRTHAPTTAIHKGSHHSGSGGHVIPGRLDIVPTPFPEGPPAPWRPGLLPILSAGLRGG